MKRFHIHVGVKDLEKSVQFYSTLFGQEPTKLKDNYAKWALEDPRLNFAISVREQTGVNHLGIQVEEPSELEEIKQRLKNAELQIFDEGETTCCYARSDKAWVSDPADIPWEAYQNMADVEIYSEPRQSDNEESCCAPSSESEDGCSAGTTACC